MAASIFFQPSLSMSPNVSTSGTTEEGATNTHHTIVGQLGTTFTISDDVARRAMMKLNRALERNPNRELREGILILRTVFGDL